jgi:hypothetical protein
LKLSPFERAQNSPFELPPTLFLKKFDSARHLDYKQNFEGMVYRSSYPMASLAAVLAGFCGFPGPAAHAGDRIEFSAPAPLLEVPQSENETKLDAVTVRQSAFASHKLPQSFDGGTGMTIIVPLPKPQDRFGWKAPFGADSDQEDSAGLDLFAPKKPSALNKNPAKPPEVDLDLSNDEHFSMREQWRVEHNLSRLGMSGLDDDNGEDSLRPGGRLANSGVSDWFRSMGSHEKQSANHMHAEIAPPGRDGKQDPTAFYQQPFHDFSLPDPLRSSDPLHVSAYSSTSPNSAHDLNDRTILEQRRLLDRRMLDQGLSDGNDSQAQLDTSLPRAWDSLPTIGSARRPAARAETFSAPSRAPSAPAVLAFPRRPGDLFQ